MLNSVADGIYARGQVASRVWPYMLSLAMAYFVTLTLFPGIEAEIVSCSLGTWMPVLLMASFNLCDFLGKVSTTFHFVQQLFLIARINLIIFVTTSISITDN
jgi:solute carrier family 29 (equilibrative nucleoside transporter) protein 4